METDLRPKTHKRLFGFDLDRGLLGKEMKLEMGLDSGMGREGKQGRDRKKVRTVVEVEIELKLEMGTGHGGTHL